MLTPSSRARVRSSRWRPSQRRPSADRVASAARPDSRSRAGDAPRSVVSSSGGHRRGPRRRGRTAARPRDRTGGSRPAARGSSARSSSPGTGGRWPGSQQPVVDDLRQDGLGSRCRKRPAPTPSAKAATARYPMFIAPAAASDREHRDDHGLEQLRAAHQGDPVVPVHERSDREREQQPGQEARRRDHRDQPRIRGERDGEQRHRRDERAVADVVDGARPPQPPVPGGQPVLGCHAERVRAPSDGRTMIERCAT